MQREEIEQLLANLHLGRIAEILDAELRRATAEDFSHEELLVRLLRAQWHHRQESALAWRIKRARLPEQWTLESFPFKKQPGVSRRQMRNFAELIFRRQGREPRFHGTDWGREDRTCHGASPQGLTERTSLPVRSGTRSVR